jgi:hypothetical protein
VPTVQPQNTHVSSARDSSEVRFRRRPKYFAQQCRISRQVLISRRVLRIPHAHDDNLSLDEWTNQVLDSSAGTIARPWVSTSMLAGNCQGIRSRRGHDPPA